MGIRAVAGRSLLAILNRYFTRRLDRARVERLLRELDPGSHHRDIQACLERENSWDALRKATSDADET